VNNLNYYYNYPWLSQTTVGLTRELTSPQVQIVPWEGCPLAKIRFYQERSNGCWSRQLKIFTVEVV
jgi:hypothetical protein